jgi:hypothetical protein
MVKEKMQFQRSFSTAEVGPIEHRKALLERFLQKTATN